MYGEDSSLKQISDDVIGQSAPMFSQVIYDGSPHVIIFDRTHLVNYQIPEHHGHSFDKYSIVCWRSVTVR